MIRVSSLESCQAFRREANGDNTAMTHLPLLDICTFVLVIYAALVFFRSGARWSTPGMVRRVSRISFDTCGIRSRWDVRSMFSQGATISGLMKALLLSIYPEIVAVSEFAIDVRGEQHMQRDSGLRPWPDSCNRPPQRDNSQVNHVTVQERTGRRRVPMSANPNSA